MRSLGFDKMTKFSSSNMNKSEVYPLSRENVSLGHLQNWTILLKLALGLNCVNNRVLIVSPMTVMVETGTGLEQRRKSTPALRLKAQIQSIYASTNNFFETIFRNNVCETQFSHHKTRLRKYH